MSVHPEAVGSVIQPFSPVTSVLRDGTVDTIVGIDDDPL